MANFYQSGTSAPLPNHCTGGTTRPQVFYLDIQPVRFIDQPPTDIDHLPSYDHLFPYDPTVDDSNHDTEESDDWDQWTPGEWWNDDWIEAVHAQNNPEDELEEEGDDDDDDDAATVYTEFSCGSQPVFEEIETDEETERRAVEMWGPQYDPVELLRRDMPFRRTGDA